VDLSAAVEGVEVPSPCGGRAFLVEKPVGKLDETAARVGEQLRDKLERSDSGLRRRLCLLAETGELSPGDVIFLDVETAGLSNAPLFLIGTMVWEDGGLVVRQYFARNDAEESAVTSLFIEAARSKQMLISFNGKSFDWPFVRTRAAANAVRCPIAPAVDRLPAQVRRASRTPSGEPGPPGGCISWSVGRWQAGGSAVPGGRSGVAEGDMGTELAAVLLPPLPADDGDRQRVDGEDATLAGRLVVEGELLHILGDLL